MSMPEQSDFNSNECYICYYEYDTITRKPCSGSCGHSICISCRDQMKTTKCPQCNQEESFIVTTINHLMLRIIDQLRYMQGVEEPEPLLQPISEKLKEFLEKFQSERLSTGKQLQMLQKLNEGVCDECGQSSCKIRICVTCAVDQKVLIRVNDQFEINDGEEAVEKKEHILTCGSCALDGKYHIGHKTMQLAALKFKSDDDELEARFGRIHDGATETSDNLLNWFRNVVESLHDYLRLYEILPLSERKLHLENVKKTIEKVYEKVSQVVECSERLEVWNNTVAEQMECRRATVVKKQ